MLTVSWLIGVGFFMLIVIGVVLWLMKVFGMVYDDL